jgi:hypothetical protein
VAEARTYAVAETNPRIIPLEQGTYEVEVRAPRIAGASAQLSGVVVAPVQAVEREVDFGTGELAIKVARNGGLSDATISIHPAGAKAWRLRSRRSPAARRRRRSAGS